MTTKFIKILIKNKNINLSIRDIFAEEEAWAEIIYTLNQLMAVDPG